MARPTHEETRRRISSPEGRRGQPSPPPVRRLAGFSDNVPPNFIPIKVCHQGHLHVARFIKVKFNDDPIVYGTMGEGLPVYEQPAHAAPHITTREAPPYTHIDTLLLHSKYPGQRTVNNALINIGDDGLRAEVHRYRKMMEEADSVERQISVLQDRMSNLQLDLHPILQRLAEAEAVKRVEEHRARAVDATLVHPWVLEQGRLP